MLRRDNGMMTIVRKRRRTKGCDFQRKVRCFAVGKVVRKDLPRGGDFTIVRVSGSLGVCVRNFCGYGGGRVGRGEWSL